MANEGRKRFTVLVLVGVVAAMGAAAYAAVPAYRLFCQVTGFGGTTQRAESAPATVGERVVTVQFDANTGLDLPWRFGPAQREIAVHVGEESLAFYTAENLSDRAVMGQAIFNVSPPKVGQYFNKIECFCFTEQVLAPGQTARMPVSFFVAPEFADDPDMADVSTITLSYTFYKREMTDAEKRAYRDSAAAAPDMQTRKRVVN